MAAGSQGLSRRTLALGSKECGLVYERDYAILDITDIAATFNEERFRTWARTVSRSSSVALMVVTCGSLSHRFFFLHADSGALLMAEWSQSGWLMLQEFQGESDATLQQPGKVSQPPPAAQDAKGVTHGPSNVGAKPSAKLKPDTAEIIGARQAAMRRKCIEVRRNPGEYGVDLIELCRR